MLAPLAHHRAEIIVELGIAGEALFLRRAVDRFVGERLEEPSIPARQVGEIEEDGDRQRLADLVDELAAAARPHALDQLDRQRADLVLERVDHVRHQREAERLPELGVPRRIAFERQLLG